MCICHIYIKGYLLTYQGLWYLRTLPVLGLMCIPKLTIRLQDTQAQYLFRFTPLNGALLSSPLQIRVVLHLFFFHTLEPSLMINSIYCSENSPYFCKRKLVSKNTLTLVIVSSKIHIGRIYGPSLSKFNNRLQWKECSENPAYSYLVIP